MRFVILLSSLMALAVLFALPGHGEAAEKFVVTSTADAPDAKPGDGVCADAKRQCTLRAAVDEANAKNIPARIELGPGRYEIESPLKATAPISVRGSQPKDTIVATSASFQGERLFVFDSAGAPDWRELSDLTFDGSGRTAVIANLRGVPLRITRSVVRGGGSSREGGAGIMAMGPLVLLRSTLVENRIEEGGGRGGALLIEEAPAWMTQSTLTRNVGRNSGGIFARSAVVVIDHSTLVGNTGSPVGAYQQNPKSKLQIRGSWFGESQVLSGKRRLDCRSTSREGQGIFSDGDNLLAVTGPTSDKLVDGVWLDSYEFFCSLTGANDRMGSLAAPLEGAWRVVTGPTGLVGVEAASTHPASRMVRPDRCPAEDAWGRPIAQGQNCDAGALYASVWTSPPAPPATAPPSAGTEPSTPASQDDKTPPPAWLWVVGFGLAALIAGFFLRRRRK